MAEPQQTLMKLQNRLPVVPTCPPSWSLLGIEHLSPDCPGPASPVTMTQNTVKMLKRWTGIKWPPTTPFLLVFCTQEVFLMIYIKVQQTFIYKEPDSKYFRLCMPFSLSHTQLWHFSKRAAVDNM